MGHFRSCWAVGTLGALGLAASAGAREVATEPVRAASTSTSAEIAEVAAAPAPVQAIPTIPHDTPVHLMVLNEVTTKTHSAGHKFQLRLDRPIMIGQRIAVPVGATAWGEVTSGDASGNVGKPGSLSARLLYLEVDGRQLSISGETSARGKGGGAETVMGVLALGPFGLFAKGNNAKIKAGERMTAFTLADFPLTLQAPAPVPTAPAAK